jgi:type IV secretory pathway TraG/TraD family ATPase VirD4
MVGAHTKGQFHMIYGTEGAQALFTGLATPIVIGGCDHDTARFYSDTPGTVTADANPDPQEDNFRQRPLLTVDEVVTPIMGNCTLFARHVESAFATQVILAVEGMEPLLLERGISLKA